MHSQNDEDEVLKSYFGDQPDGYFLDVGSYSMESFSNVRRFLEQGWSGALVEADPFAMAGLFSSTEKFGNRAHLILGCVTTEQRHPIPFHLAPSSGVSTTSSVHADKWSSHCKFREISVATISLHDLLLSTRSHVDLLNIDVESESVHLFEWLSAHEKFSCRAAVVEHDGHYARCDEAATRLGLRKISQNQENAIYTLGGR